MMQTARRLIDEAMYLRGARAFVARLQSVHEDRHFDAVVAPKRSGLFLGAWASYALGIPFFVPSELRNAPQKFRRILIVDTAVCTGKTLQKIRNQMGDRETFTAVIWREGSGACDLVLYPENIGIIDFFYERRVCREEYTISET